MKESLNIPLFANGDIFTSEDADRVVAYTKADGVMAARGLLENPALFSGYHTTPVEAVQDFIYSALGYGMDQFIFHHHLMFMLEKSMTKTGTRSFLKLIFLEKKMFNCLFGIPAILDYLYDNYGIRPTPFNHDGDSTATL